MYETHTFSPNLINEAQASYSRPEGVTGTEMNGKSAMALGINTMDSPHIPKPHK